jgi:hypothetical protein
LTFKVKTSLKSVPALFVTVTLYAPECDEAVAAKSISPPVTPARSWPSFIQR